MHVEDDQEFCQMDFTTASDWEIFISQLEEILIKWKTNRANTTIDIEDKLKWTIKGEKIRFKDVQFLLSYYHFEEDNEDKNKIEKSLKIDESNVDALEDMMVTEKDFKSVSINDNTRNINCLVQWYGLRDFVVLTPSGNIPSESKIKFLLSSFCVAAGNVNWETPLFAQVLELWQNYFTGICISKGIRAEYQMIHLKKIPNSCRYLSGILGVFKSKITSSLMSLEPVVASVRFSYKIDNWINFFYPPSSNLNTNLLELINLSSLPFGTANEPVKELVLYTTWPEVFENIIVDRETYTDLEPNLAPVWSLTMMPSWAPNCLLMQFMMEYLNKCNDTTSLKDLIGDLYQKNRPDLDFGFNPNLAELKLPIVSKLLHEVDEQVPPHPNLRNPIPDDVLMPLLYLLFPDADIDSGLTYTVYNSHNCPENTILNSMKSCSEDGLIWRLALVMSQIIHTFGHIRTVAHLWYEFTQELRYRWENGILIPGVSVELTDHKTCLLNQKIQLLNRCIKKKIEHELDQSSKLVDLENDSENEEFYDCQVESDKNKKEERVGNKETKYSLWNQPEGRLHKYGDLRLINTGEHLYVPITQEVTPKTEDQLEEDAAILMELGSDSIGSELRSRLMSASLYSDMESFKAANPGAVLEDFIRWYSPRDWIEEEELDEYDQKKGSLSARMTLPGNMWQEVWDTSKPVPATRQKHLFDEAQEAEKILHFLDCASPADALCLLLPAFTKIVLSTLIQQVSNFPFLQLESKVSAIAKKAVNLSREVTTELLHYRDLAEQIGSIEAMISQYNSLKYKLFPDGSQVSEQNYLLFQLINGTELEIHSDELRSRIFILFSEIHKASHLATEQDNETSRRYGSPQIQNNFSDYKFPPPFQKEFIVRIRAPRPSATSRTLPHKLTAKVLSDKIIMASCYSHDTVFT